MLSLDAASWASFTQRLTTSKLHFSRCWGQWDLLKGQKEGCPLVTPMVPSQMQSEPPHCPDPMNKQHSCRPHSPCLADFLPDPGPKNLPSKGVGVAKPLTPALPSGPRVSGSLLTRLSVYSTFNPHPCRSSYSYIPGKTQGQSWRRWVPCPQSLVSCSAQQPAAWCSVVEGDGAQAWKPWNAEQSKHIQKLL